MKRRLPFVCLCMLAFAMLATGCATGTNTSAWWQRLYQLEAGTPKAQVMEQLGTPMAMVKIPAEPPYPAIEMWTYACRFIGTVRVVIDNQGRFLTWFTFFDDAPRVHPRPLQTDDTAEQIRGLRQDFDAYRALSPR